MFLLDTNVISEMRKGERSNPNVREWARSIQPSDLYLSAATVLELEQGVLLLERRDPIKAIALREWLDGNVIPSFAGQIFSIDVKVARRCAALHVPQRRPDRDAFIAATAIVHGLTVVTRNTQDFEAMGVPLINPWLSTNNNKGKDA